MDTFTTHAFLPSCSSKIFHKGTMCLCNIRYNALVKLDAVGLIEMSLPHEFPQKISVSPYTNPGLDDLSGNVIYASLPWSLTEGALSFWSYANPVLRLRLKGKIPALYEANVSANIFIHSSVYCWKWTMMTLHAIIMKDMGIWHTCCLTHHFINFSGKTDTACNSHASKILQFSLHTDLAQECQYLACFEKYKYQILAWGGDGEMYWVG